MSATRTGLAHWSAKETRHAAVKRFHAADMAVAAAEARAAEAAASLACADGVCAFLSIEYTDLRERLIFALPTESRRDREAVYEALEGVISRIGDAQQERHKRSSEAGTATAELEKARAETQHAMERLMEAIPLLDSRCAEVRAQEQSRALHEPGDRVTPIGVAVFAHGLLAAGAPDGASASEPLVSERP